MSLDHTSLLLAIVLLSACLSVVLFSGWLITRTERFLFTWSVGLAVLVVAMGLFILHIEGPRPLFALPAFSLLLIGFSIVEGAGRQFCDGAAPIRRIAVISAVSVALIAPFFLTGITGMGTSLVNALACAILISAGLHYWQSRSEAPALISVLTGLYVIVGLSFLVCAAVILMETPIYRVRNPNNWAENLNALAAIIGLSGIGAISLALNQSRLVRHLRMDSRTDPLTGLNNRRALFERHGEGPLPIGTVVAIFDLDHFKKVNDQYGHAIGDEVLKRFARLLDRHAGTTAMAARTGGEEFVLIFEKPPADSAHVSVDRIRETFANTSVRTAKGALRCTVSVGVSLAVDSRRTLEAVLREADAALYLAKDGGRNKVAMNRVLAAA